MDSLNPHTATFNPALPLINISPSPTNPRKRFDVVALEELTNSIKSKGVLQPVIVRRLTSAVATSDYELVVGERRFRACKAAGLETIPATIRDLSDIEVLEIQIIENDQREGVHPMEEAEGYDRLLKSPKADGSAHTPEDIVAKIGKSRTYVYNRLKLLDLFPEGRAAFFDGGIDQTRAQMIARLGHHDTQRAALKDLQKKNYAGDLIYSARAARDHLEREYMLALKDAPFDIKVVDYTTAKGKAIAGACGPCPKRSGNNPDLFGDVKGADTCTDVKCFHAKRSAEDARVEADFAARGLKVVTGKEAAKILPSSWNNDATGDYVSEGQFTTDRKTTYGKIAGKAVQPIMVKRDGSKEFVKVYPLADLKKLMKEKGIKVAASDDKPRELQRAQQEKASAKSDLDERVRKCAYTYVRARIATGLAEEDWRLLARKILDIQNDYEFPEFVATLYAPEAADRNSEQYADVRLLRKALDALPMASIPRFICDVLHNDVIETGWGPLEQTKDLDALFARYKIDTKAIRVRLIAEDKAAAKAVKKPTAPVTAAIAPVVETVIEPLIKPLKKTAKKK